jgi:3-phosphoshikimate 1-carboxyvinyltransferase
LSRINVRYRGPLSGEITAPPDKSISHRAVIFASLATGESIIRNFLFAEDPVRTLEAFRAMGVEIRDTSSGGTGRILTVRGSGLYGLSAPSGPIDCGNSGSTMRMLCGVLAGQPFTAELHGDASLTRRPMNRVIAPLTEMGGSFRSQIGGYPPLTINGGELHPISYSSPVASAQVKSAILLAGLYCNETTSVAEPGKSRDHTERMLKAAGADIAVRNLDVSIRGGRSLAPQEYTVPGDFSSASFFIVAGAIVPGSEIMIRDTGINPTRTGLIEVLRLMGADISIENRKEVSGEPVADIRVKHAPLRGIEIGQDLVLRAIDEFPIICVAAAKAAGATEITGAEELRVKESDRIASVASELRKTGVIVEELKDGLIIEGRENLLPAETLSHGDHRIAMAMAIAGLTVKNESTVDNADCIKTSFPEFMAILDELTKQTR